MPDLPENIHPVFDAVIPRREKEARLNQTARVIWLFGLSGAGKSTLASALDRRLADDGFVNHLLDGDNVRTGLNRDLGFDDAGRAENIRRVAEVSRLFVDAGVIVISAFITPTRALRELARGIVGAADFSEVYVEASWETCRRRDPKGLYARAHSGEVAQFTGRDSPFEPPERADLVVSTDALSVPEALERIWQHVRPKLRAAG